VDIITLAMNLFANGVDPELDITDIDSLRRAAEYCNRLPVHPRHPYVGDLVYTAFSGSHQDAIKKGLEALAPDYDHWAVPYLPIDPKHVGRTYEAVIRVNSQSGKGGVAYVMKEEHGFDLPRRLQIEFSKTIQHITEDSGTEITPASMWDSFRGVYFPEKARFRLRSQELHTSSRDGMGHTTITAHLDVAGEVITVVGEGEGPSRRIRERTAERWDVYFDVDYSEHAIEAVPTPGRCLRGSFGDDASLKWGMASIPASRRLHLAVLAAFERQHG
jgi:2-isopropylmalate synthase